MTQGQLGKAKRALSRGTAGVATATVATAPDGPAPALRIKALEGELAVAQARIAVLESARDETVNRIDWVLDSLNGALQRLD